MAGVKVGYARVSSTEQNLEMQIEYLKGEGVDSDLIFTDRCSGTIPFEAREGGKKVLAELRTKDELVVYKLDRLSRRANELKSLLLKLKNTKKVSVYSSDIPELKDLPESMRDLVTDIVVSILSFTAEAERNHIKERQRRGIENAKKKGLYKGRPTKYSAESNDSQGRMIYNRIVEMIEDGYTIRSIANECGVGLGTVQRIKKELEN